jgi:hypothetical protein
MDDEDGVEHASRSSGLLRLEASRDMVSQSALKTGGGIMRMVHMASSQRLRRVKAEDGRIDATGRIRSFYHNFAVFYVLSLRGIVVFYLGL